MNSSAAILANVIANRTIRPSQLQLSAKRKARASEELLESEMQEVADRLRLMRTRLESRYGAEMEKFLHDFNNVEQALGTLHKKLSDFHASTSFYKSRYQAVREVISWSLGLNLGIKGIDMGFLAETRVQERRAGQPAWNVPVFAVYDLNLKMACRLQVIESPTGNSQVMWPPQFFPFENIVKAANVSRLDRNTEVPARLNQIKSFLGNSRQGLILPDSIREILRDALDKSLVSDLLLIVVAENWTITEKPAEIPRRLNPDALVVGKLVVPGHLPDALHANWMLLGSFKLVPAERNPIRLATKGLF